MEEEEGPVFPKARADTFIYIKYNCQILNATNHIKNSKKDVSFW